VVQPRIDDRGIPVGPPPPEVSPGVVPYDPKAAETLLDQARAELLDCFFERDGDRTDRSRSTLDERNGKPYGQFQDDLVALAHLGRTLYLHATGQVESDAEEEAPPQWTRRMRRALAERGVIQVARTGPANYVFPWALVYDYQLSRDAKPKFCPVVREWEHGERPAQHGQLYCPHRDKDFHQRNVYCPFGFWGLQHVIEQPPSPARVLSTGGWKIVDARRKIRAGPAMDVGIGATRDARLTASVLADHWKRVGGIESVQVLPSSPAGDVASVRPLLEGSAVIYFLCHGRFDPVREMPYLGIGPDEPNDRYQLFPGDVQDWANDPALEDGEWLDRNPLVLINGCHTAELEPGNILNFVTAFTYAGASGVIGTEIPVRLPLATEVAEMLLTKLARRMAVGEALRQVRWELANRGNLLGLAYTLYGLADLRLVREGAPA
jgi:CHAT domain-containing protein